MSLSATKPKLGLEAMGVFNTGTQHWNLPPAMLVEECLKRGEGQLAASGALCIDTGEFTGRSPKDKFVVKDDLTADTIWWGSVNKPVTAEKFAGLWRKVTAFLQGRELYCRDVFAGADPRYRLKVRVVNTSPWANLFVSNMFIDPDTEVLEAFVPDWKVIAAPDFHALPDEDSTRQHNFTLINFKERLILVGGSGYTGEIKKGIFTVLNYLLPNQGVMPMHCSANVGEKNDAAIFFGLSGTGKTTLSADPERRLIGDDEHGWSDQGIFNFEGGCYAKCIDLSEEKEPQIWQAIRHGALVENTRFHSDSREINFADSTVTENTRVSYPLSFIEGVMKPSMGDIPKNIFFLTCDAFGVLPPISRLNPEQAMYHFISGYTAKVAGTEEGITEPVTAFSSCFGEPFLPLHPTRYAEMLGEKIRQYKVNVWLVNTGWTGGPYGVGSRISLTYTRAMIQAALEGKLEDADFETDPYFGLNFPVSVPGVPADLLNPRSSWSDPESYDAKARALAKAFEDNFRNYAQEASEAILASGPVLVAG